MLTHSFSLCIVCRDCFRWHVARPKTSWVPSVSRRTNCKHCVSSRGALTLVSFDCSLQHVIISGGASAVKEPGHFEVRKSSSQVTRMHYFLRKSWRPFLVVALKHRPLTPFHRQNKTNKAVRYGNIFILFSHCYRSKAIRRARQRAEPGIEPGRWIFQPGHLTWRALV